VGGGDRLGQRGRTVTEPVVRAHLERVADTVGQAADDRAVSPAHPSRAAVPGDVVVLDPGTVGRRGAPGQGHLLVTRHRGHRYRRAGRTLLLLLIGLLAGARVGRRHHMPVEPLATRDVLTVLVD